MEPEFDIEQIRKFVKKGYNPVAARYVKSALAHYDEVVKNNVVLGFVSGSANDKVCTANNCDKPAIGDYNGKGAYACKYHMRKWDKEFEDDYK